jgi:hypothetical protein
MSLKKKRRKAELLKLWGSTEGLCAVPYYLEPTTNAARGDVFYVTKVDTRIEDPWADRDVVDSAA